MYGMVSTIVPYLVQEVKKTKTKRDTEQEHPRNRNTGDALYVAQTLFTINVYPISLSLSFSLSLSLSDTRRKSQRSSVVVVVVSRFYLSTSISISHETCNRQSFDCLCVCFFLLCVRAAAEIMEWGGMTPSIIQSSLSLCFPYVYPFFYYSSLYSDNFVLLLFLSLGASFRYYNNLSIYIYCLIG